MSTARPKKNKEKHPITTPYSVEEILNTAKRGSVANVKKIMTHFIENNQIEQLEKLTTKNNNTILHNAVEHNSIEVVLYLLTALGKHTQRFCRLINSEGKLPLQLVDRRKNAETRRRMINALLPLTAGLSFKKMSEPLDVNDVLKRYPESLLNDELTYNLRVACEAVNLCRQFVTFSTTHPTFNTISPEEKYQNGDKLNGTRDRVSAMVPMMSLKNNQTLLENLRREMKIIQETGAANCGEYANMMLAYLLILTKGRAVHIAIIHIAKGDHVLNIIGHRFGSNLNKPETLGENAVFADAWSGDVYPASERHNKLMAYLPVHFNSAYKSCENDDPDLQQENSFRVLYHFNPNHHKLLRLKSVMMTGGANMKTREFKQSMARQSFFAANFLKEPLVVEEKKRDVSVMSKKRKERDADDEPAYSKKLRLK